MELHIRGKLFFPLKYFNEMTIPMITAHKENLQKFSQSKLNGTTGSFRKHEIDEVENYLNKTVLIQSSAACVHLSTTQSQVHRSHKPYDRLIQPYNLNRMNHASEAFVAKPSALVNLSAVVNLLMSADGN